MNTNINRLKGVFGVLGGVAFLVAGILMALSTRKNQLSGAPIPNGKGGFMSFRDVYYLSFTLVVMAAAWIYFGYRQTRAQTKQRPSNKPPPNA